VIIILIITTPLANDKKNDEDDSASNRHLPTSNTTTGEKEPEDGPPQSSACQLCVDFAGRDLDIRSPVPGYYPAKFFPVTCGTCGKTLVLKVQGQEKIYYIIHHWLNCFIECILLYISHAAAVVHCDM
jgi:hypothetical protein